MRHPSSEHGDDSGDRPVAFGRLSTGRLDLARDATRLRELAERIGDGVASELDRRAARRGTLASCAIWVRPVLVASAAVAIAASLLLVGPGRETPAAAVAATGVGDGGISAILRLDSLPARWLDDAVNPSRDDLIAAVDEGLP